jgi:peptide/nickel transport system permease protein
MKLTKQTLSWLPETWRNAARHQKAGALILIVVTFVGVLAPVIAPYSPETIGTPYQGQSLQHFLGTDELGRHNFSRLLYGILNTLEIAVVAALFSLVIGVFVGVYAGYYGGKIEELLMGTTDVILLIPTLPLMILMASYLSPSEWNIVAIFALLWWCPTARIVHARTLQIRGQSYVRSAQALGYDGGHIIRQHFIPNCYNVIAVKFAMGVALAILVETTLSFLGLGDPLSITWGSMVNAAFTSGGFANDYWWWYLPPCLMITLIASAFMLISTVKERERKWQI